MFNLSHAFGLSVRVTPEQSVSIARHALVVAGAAWPKPPLPVSPAAASAAILCTHVEARRGLLDRRPPARARRC
jgi:hypothetical protein